MTAGTAPDVTRPLPPADGARPGPHGSRLLAGWFTTGRPADPPT